MDINVEIPKQSWWQRLRLSLKSPYVTYLEQRVHDLEEREKLLLDKILVRTGYGPMAASPERKSVPNPQPVHPWRVMAQREAQAWDEFNERFPSIEEVQKERQVK